MSSNLSIPDTVPARPGASLASANDLRGGFQSSTLNMATGEVVVERKGVVKADTAAAGTGSAVFSRVRSPSGMIEDAGLDTIVSGPSIPGDGVRLRDALAAGFVSRDAAGNYVAGPGTFDAAAQKSLADKTDADKADDEKAEKDKGDQGEGERMGDETEKTIDTLIEGSTPDDQLAAVHQVAATGEVDPALIATVAQSMGVETEALQGQIGGVLEAFESQARDVITKAAGGIDSERVLEWVREHRADELNKAMVAQGTQRSTTGYASLAREYVNGLDEYDPDSILTADFTEGVSARRDENGKVIINVNGTDYTWRSAIAGGFISVTGG